MRYRLLLFRLRVRTDLTLPGDNASYSALWHLLLVRLPSRNTLPLPGGNATYAAPRRLLPVDNVYVAPSRGHCTMCRGQPVIESFQ